MFELEPNGISLKKTFKKSETMLEELRKAAEEALNEEKAKDYAKGMKESAASVQRSVGSMKRALAGFDELNRMNRLKSATAAAKSKEQLLLEYLNSVDFNQTISKLQLVRSYIVMCGQEMDKLIDQIYLTNMAMKLQESVLDRHSAAWQSLATYMNIVGTVLQRLTQMTTHWNSQASQMAITATTLKSALTSLQAGLEATGIQVNAAQVYTLALAGRWSTLLDSGTKLSSLLSVLRSRFMGLFDEQVQQSLTGADNHLRQSLFLMQQYLQSGFFPAWKQAWGQIAGAVAGQMEIVPGSIKTMLNQTIELFNGFLSKLTTGFNSWITSANQLQLKLGAYTGNPVLRLPAMSTPKIPLLAQGAVLPANKPFMAVVGDQRHGTNIEAPLSTIQEAVALVMQEHLSANMAGHEATVAVLREILQAVLGISIGDDVIGAAVQRYRSKMAVVTGGVV